MGRSTCLKIHVLRVSFSQSVFFLLLGRISFDPQYFIKAGCLDSGTEPPTVRYTMKFTQYDKGTEVAAASHIEEKEDGTFEHDWTRIRIHSRTSKTNLDIVRPGKRYSYVCIIILVTVSCKIRNFSDEI